MPGPQGDYHIWGWPDPAVGFRYIESEQAAARAKLNAPVASIGSWATNGVMGLSTQEAGTISTNASPGSFNPNSLTNQPDEPEQEQDPPSIPLYVWIILVVVAVGMLGVAGFFFLFVVVWLLRSRRQ